MQLGRGSLDQGICEYVPTKPWLVIAVCAVGGLCAEVFIGFALVFAPGWANGWPFGLTIYREGVRACNLVADVSVNGSVSTRTTQPWLALSQIVAHGPHGRLRTINSLKFL